VISCQFSALEKMYKSRRTGGVFELSLPSVHCIWKYVRLSGLTLYNPP